MSPVASRIQRLLRNLLTGPGRPDGVGVTLGVVAVWAAVLYGCWLRIGLWWENRAFWRDELGLLQSLDTFAAGRLLGPLADAQSAPPGWLLAERAVTTLLGAGERAYRLLPLLLGCGVLVLTAWLAMRLTRRAGFAAIAVLLLATLPQAVFYSAQAKHYTTDMFCVVGLLLLATHLIEHRPGGPSRHLEWVFYAGITVGAWFSFGLMLTAPLVAAWVGFVQLRRGDRTLRQVAVRLAAPAVSVFLTALHARALTSRVPDFADYWSTFMRPRGSGPIGGLEWTVEVVDDLLLYTLKFAPVAVGGLLLAAGAIAALATRRVRTRAILLLLPLVAPYLAAVFGAYPFGRRLVLFAIPGLLILLAIGVDALADRVTSMLERRIRAASAAAAGSGVGLAAAVGVAAATWSTPAELDHVLTYEFGIEDYRAQLAFVADKWSDDDLLIVGNGDRTAFRFYGPRLGLPADRALRAMPHPDATTRNEQDEPVPCALPPIVADAGKIWLLSGDVVTLYQGEPSRFGLIAPLLDDFRRVYFEDRGLVTVQALLPGGDGEPAPPARCLDYAPVGSADAPAYPERLPAPSRR